MITLNTVKLSQNNNLKAKNQPKLAPMMADSTSFSGGEKFLKSKPAKTLLGTLGALAGLGISHMHRVQQNNRNNHAAVSAQMLIGIGQDSYQFNNYHPQATTIAINGNILKNIALPQQPQILSLSLVEPNVADVDNGIWTRLNRNSERAVNTEIEEEGGIGRIADDDMARTPTEEELGLLAKINNEEDAINNLDGYNQGLAFNAKLYYHESTSDQNSLQERKEALARSFAYTKVLHQNLLNNNNENI